MTDPIDNISADNIRAALRGYYTPTKPGPTVLATADLCALLAKLPALSTDDHVDPILVQLQKHHPGLGLSAEDHSTLAFIDDAITQVLRKTDLDFKIEAYIRDLAPYAAMHAFEDDVRVLTRPLPILALIDMLIAECMGWSEDLGVLGDQFIEKVDVPVRSLIAGRLTLEACHDTLTELFSKENPIFEKMEARLAESELTVLAGQKAKYYAAQLMNEEMAGKQLPLFIIFMLQGSWYEFLQNVFTRYGIRSRQWKNATKLTQALVWSLQPQTDTHQQRRLISELPDQLKKFCSQLDFDTTETEACFADVEAEHEKIVQESPSDGCDFELIEIDRSLTDMPANVEPEYLRRVEQLEPGRWFLFDDKNEPEEKVARIKLILNWRDTQRLLFTNHNRRKVMQMSYGELAGYLASDTVRVLTLQESTSQIIREHLVTVVHHIQQQKKKEIQVDEQQTRKAISRKYLANRKQALLQALQQHQKLAKLKQKRALLLREKASKKLKAASNAVNALRVDAWVKLPIMEGTLTPCKLVAIIPALSKYIFANRAGIKVAEYTSGQLSHMIVTENSEILDTGTEFESVLATVVIGLRADKSKSYDELTGDTGT